MTVSTDRVPLRQTRRANVRFTAWRTFLHSHSLVVSRVERRLEAGLGLPFTWYDVLFQLSEAPDRRLRMHELAEAVLLSRSGLTRTVDRIEAAGLVVRQAIPGDRRSLHVVLTDAGRERLAAAFPIVRRAVRELFADHLSEDDADNLVRILGRIRDRARGATGERRGTSDQAMAQVAGPSSWPGAPASGGGADRPDPRA